MRQVSVHETARQITREGARLGLVPLVENGVCYVAEKTRELQRCGPFDVVVDGAEKLCNITMQHPITNIYKSRKQRGEHDMVKWYRSHRLARDAKAAKEAEERSKDRMRELVRIQRQVGKQDMGEAFIESLRRARTNIGA